MQLDFEEIKSLSPAFSLIMLDRVVELELASAWLRSRTSRERHLLSCHFPEKASCPGGIIEAMAQRHRYVRIERTAPEGLQTSVLLRTRSKPAFCMRPLRETRLE